MADHLDARSVVRKIIITVLVGVISFPITDLIFSSLPAQFAMATAFGSVVLLIQFLLDFEKRLAQVERGQVESTAEVQRTVARSFSNINEATRLYARSETVGLKGNAVVRLAQSATEVNAELTRLTATLAESEIDRVTAFLQGLANHEATYDGEDQDWLLTLTRNAVTSIDAISLPAVDFAMNNCHGFWESDLGFRYLELQRDAIQRNVVVRRLFVVESAAMMADPTFQDIYRSQLNVGVDVRLLHPPAVPQVIRGSLFDVVLFDNTISREVTPWMHVPKGEGPTILSTRLTTHPVRVAERIERFRKIWSSAVPWHKLEIELAPQSPRNNESFN